MRLAPITALILSVFLNVASGGCGATPRRPNVYLIPQGYVGWVRINYRIKEAPLLPVEGGYYLCRFPPNGLINTSSEGEEGAAEDKYFYFSDDTKQPIPSTGTNRLIWGSIGFGSFTSTSTVPTKYEEFFVGSEDQYERVGLKCKDTDLNPIVGPITNCPGLAGSSKDH